MEGIKEEQGETLFDPSEAGGDAVYAVERTGAPCTRVGRIVDKRDRGSSDLLIEAFAKERAAFEDLLGGKCLTQDHEELRSDPRIEHDGESFAGRRLGAQHRERALDGHKYPRE